MYLLHVNGAGWVSSWSHCEVFIPSSVFITSNPYKDKSVFKKENVKCQVAVLLSALKCPVEENHLFS